MPDNFFMLRLQPNNPHVFGLDMEKLGFVVSKWYHDVTMSARRFLAPGRDAFTSLMSLFCSFCFRQFCSPLVGLFWLVPGFVELDQVMP